MSDESKGFTVKDRRHLTAEGEARDSAPVEVSSTRPEPAASAPAAHAHRERGPAVADEAVDFSSFLFSLGAQAGSLLASGGGREGESLAAARQIIAVLEMLEGKTAGRRTPDEDRLLGNLLFELRMAYVEATSGVKA